MPGQEVNPSREKPGADTREHLKPRPLPHPLSSDERREVEEVVRQTVGQCVDVPCQSVQVNVGPAPSGNGTDRKLINLQNEVWVYFNYTVEPL